MKLDSEIKRAILYINDQMNIKNTENEEDKKNIREISKRVSDELENNSYGFSQLSSIVLKQGTKKRLVKRFNGDFSTENILCHCIKQILDREFKIKYPNRNKISRSLFNVIGTIKHMSEFTIIRFDFKNYFNSISSVYVYKKSIQSNLRNRFEKDLINKFVTDTKYAFAGLPTSNVIAEIIGKLFDEEVLKEFLEYGLIFYERYIDDMIIILNQYLSEDEFKDKLLKSIVKVFHDKSIESSPDCVSKCTTKMNMEKFRYISKKDMTINKEYNLDFLGYKFILKKKEHNTEIKYGITNEKINKYKEKIKGIIALFKDELSPDYNNIELLRHRILAFSCREVYLTKKFKLNIWKVKGFISNYGELRYLLNEKGLVEKDTEHFLKNIIFDSFNESKVKIPYFLKNQGKGYSLYHNMLKNKTLLFHPHIGYSYTSLYNLCEKIGISKDSSNKKWRYDTLVRYYLIKTKVGY